MSEWALPKEPIVSWVKWDQSEVIEKILLKYEADIFIPRFLNTNPKVFEQDIQSGKIEVPTEYLEIPGFFGFHALYTALPEAERDIEFIIEFHQNGNIVHSERLTTLITRPILEVEMTPRDLIIDQATTVPSVIELQLKNFGSVQAKTVDISFEFHATDGLKVEIVSPMVTDTRRNNVAPQTAINRMSIKGKGKAIINIVLSYVDNLNNRYSSRPVSITLDVREAIQDDISFSGLRPSDELPLLTAAVA